MSYAYWLRNWGEGISEATKIEDCVPQARMLFNKTDFALTSAVPCCFVLITHDVVPVELWI